MSIQENPRNIDDGPPPTQIEESPEANPRLLEAVREYQAATDAGRKPNRRDFLARYADVGDDLADCLDGLDFVHSAAPRLTGSDAAKSTRPTAEVLNPEQPLGDFRIVREIGRGGMGIVYEAVQLSLGRRVALKVLPFAATLDARQLQRFKTEAQAAAQLHHGHIVPVFFVGSERGVHFYAMQYIEGHTLAALIAELRNQTLPASPKQSEIGPMGPISPISDLSSMGPGAATIASQQSSNSQTFFRTIAQLGVQAAEALEHAHQMGVIHRDVKPANLLLDQRGCLWITDFGLARVQTDAGATASGDVVGTVRYMSPEQALGKPLVDQRTDVYSLGATLYELFTLTPAFDGRNRQDFMHQILECDPPTLRSHNPAIPADLETIVLKSLAKAPEERYNSAQELGDDLRRFLEDKPIQARRPTLVEKASKWSRRHRTLVGAAVVLLAAAVVGLSVLTVAIAHEQSKTQQAYNATQTAYNELAREQERTKAALAAERREREHVNKNFQKMSRKLEFITQIIEDELGDKSADDPNRREANRLKMLEAALAYYQDFLEEYRDDPEKREDLVGISVRLAKLLDEVGLRADAVAMLEQARRFQERRSGGRGPGGPGGGRGPGGPGGGPGGPPPFMDGMGPYQFAVGTGNFSTAVLLGQQAVQQDVKLSDEQKKEIRRLMDKRKSLLSPEVRNMRESDSGRATRLAEVEALEKKATELLTAEQQKRVQQLIWQGRGAHSLGDKDVADALDLSDEQRDRIHTILDEARGTLWKGDGGPPPRDSGRSEDYWEKVSQNTLRVLTAEQRSKWKAMKGEPLQGAKFIWPPRPETRP